MLTVRDKFLNTAKKILDNHCIYIWGGYGEKVLPMTYQDITKMETSTTNTNRVYNRILIEEALGWLTKKTKAFDCSGLVCYCLVKSGREPAGFRVRADDLFKRYPKSKVLTEGCLLHRAGHIAIYIGGNFLIEAKGRDDGVTLSHFNYKEWDYDYPNPWLTK